MAGRFEGKVVVITGAAGGIGQATAVRFAREGASVALVDLKGAPLGKALGVVEEAGGKAIVVEADVTRESDVERYVSEAVGRFGRIDCFFNNAGIHSSRKLLEEDEETFDRVFDVNVKGVWLGLKHVGARMRDGGGGVIVNTASTAGLRGAGTSFAYNASKHAVVGMTRSAALQLAPYGIRVVGVCPGWTDSPMTRKIAQDQGAGDPAAFIEGMVSRNPLKRAGEPDDVAGLVAFLCSDDASWISGGLYTVDGAATA